MRICKGQNIMEFIIILAVLVFGGIAVFTLLGNNINEMFTNSNDAFKKNEPFKWDNNTITATASAGNSPFEISKEPANSTINGVEVTYNKNGSASFNVGSQQINLSPDVMNNINTVFELSGSAGGELNIDVMNAIQKLINEHEKEFSDGVPLEISFGTGSRSMGSTDDFSGGNYFGEASINSAVISVGDHKILVQQDQSCNLGDNSGDYVCGKAHTLEIKDGKGIVSSPFDVMNGVELKDIKYDEKGFPKYGSFYGGDDFSGGSWAFDFAGATGTSI